MVSVYGSGIRLCYRLYYNYTVVLHGCAVHCCAVHCCGIRLLWYTAVMVYGCACIRLCLYTIVLYTAVLVYDSGVRLWYTILVYGCVIQL
jgi:hypothetical protein